MNLDKTDRFSLSHHQFFVQWGMLGIALLLIGLLIGFSLVKEYYNIGVQEQDRLTTQARVINRTIEQHLEAVNRGLQLVREELPEWRAFGWREVDHRLRALDDAMPGIRTIYVTDASGTVLAADRAGLSGKNFSSREYFDISRRQPDPKTLYISPPYKTLVTGILGMNVTLIIQGPHGEFNGIITATLDPSYFRNILSSVLYAPDMWSSIVHGDGLQFLMIPQRENQSGINRAVPGSFFTRHTQSGKPENVFSGVYFATGEKLMMALSTINPARVTISKPLIVTVSRGIDSLYFEWWRAAKMESMLFGLMGISGIIGLYFYQRRQENFYRREEESINALKDSELRYRRIVDTAKEGIWVTGEDSMTSFVNERMAEMLGYQAEEMIGEPVTGFMFEEDVPDHLGRMERCLQGVSDISERRFRHKNGQAVWTIASVVPIFDDEHNIKGAFAMLTDITERKKVEAEKDQFYKFFKTATDLMVIADPKGVFIKTNPACTEILGYSETEFVAKTFIEFVHPEDKQLTRDEMARQLQRGFSLNFENRFICKDGSVTWLSWRTTYNKEEGITYATARDITEKKMAELQLQEKEERIRTLSNNLPRGYVYQLVIEDNGERRFTYISDGVESIHGLHVSQVLDNPMVLYDQIDESDRLMLEKTEEEAYNKMTTFNCEAKFDTRDGKVKWLNLSSSPRKLADGSIQFDGLVMDITDKKQIEEQLVRAQKMESIGQLAGGIAHDFNNMLTAIIGYGSLLNSKLGKDSELRPYVDQILSSAGKSANLIRQLLAFSRKQEITLKETDLNELIKDMEKLLLRLIGEDIELSTKLSEKSLFVMVDPGQIEQVLMNLSTNARDAMPDGGLLSIGTDTVELDAGYIKGHDMDKPGMYALISVTDTGRGMDNKTQQKIFEPFFTTKEVGKGTGLGLSIVYGIIKQHDGNITIYSEPGKGTTFRIYLPLIESKVEETKAAEIITQEGGTETILFAEDNEDVRVISRKVLEENGYAVIDAVNGEDAINKFKENKDRIHLIVVDVIMPKKSGKEAIDEIKKIKPDVNVLFTSGYTFDIINRKGILEEGIDFISKPITPNNLLAKIREILDREARP